MEAEHEKLEETMRSEHEISIASYTVEAELQTEVTLCSVSQSVFSYFNISCFPSLPLIEMFSF